MIKQIITWLRREDQRLDPLRKQVEQQEKSMDWDQLQEICLYVIYITIVMGLGLLVAFWIMA